MSKTLLFIPMYNCEKQVVRVLDQLSEDICSWIDQVIVVNNRSTDDGEAAVMDYLGNTPPAVPVQLMRNRENYGLGGSHKVAFQYALNNGFDRVIVLHGDDQGRIADLLPVLQSGRCDEYDCCLGARFMRGSTLPGYSRFRIFGNRVFNILFSIVCGRPIYDLGSGLNLYQTASLKSRYWERYADNLTFNCHMLMALKLYRQKALFFPISWREEDQVSNVKMFRQATRTVGMLLRFLLCGKRYLTGELRDRPVEAYLADVIFASKGKGETECEKSCT